MTLTLPIVVGKKYVRRDGVVIKTNTVPGREHFALVDSETPDWSDYRSWEPLVVYRDTGRISGLSQLEDFDLVADYIEPAKGHPHAEPMAQFADDAKETETPWDRWECSGSNGVWHAIERCAPTWESWLQYRRKPTVTPDPHAASAAEYAKDMAETDKAWERWEMANVYLKGEWVDCRAHPNWSVNVSYRRKEAV